jgi:hypothetical protein
VHDRAQTLASLDRLEKIAKQMKAKVVIQHEARDVSKRPVAPQREVISSKGRVISPTVR